MNFGIAGKVALVSAASKGLGRGSAEALSAEGCRVAICARTKADVERAAREIGAKTGHQVVPFVADMSRAEEFDRLLGEGGGRRASRETAVGSAGGPPPPPSGTTKIEHFLRAGELSMMSSIRLPSGPAPAMKARNWGRIVYITSVS